MEPPKRLQQTDWATHDDAVTKSSDIDPFCSSSDWLVPAQARLGGLNRIMVAAFAGSSVTLQEVAPGVLVGFDALWGMGCAVVGPDAEAAAHLLVGCLGDDPSWHLALVPGLIPESPRYWAVARAAQSAGWEVWHGPKIDRWVASLDGGLPAYLLRRSSKFRVAQRRAARLSDEAGVTTAACDLDLDRLFATIEAVEAKSWKGAFGSGLADSDFRAFYRAIADRLLPERRLRARVAHLLGRPVGYILGGVRAGRYRGFQLAYDQDVARLSVGNLLQLAEIERLSAEGVREYDLGMDVPDHPYKARWADATLCTETVAIRRDSAR